MLVVFLVGLIPIVSPIAPAIWFLFAAWMMAIQFVDYAAENRGLEFGATIAALKANRAAALGFGAITATLLAVPLVNVVFIPAAVCGGAVLWRRLDE